MAFPALPLPPEMHGIRWQGFAPGQLSARILGHRGAPSFLEGQKKGSLEN
jgi:hypothetical protein